MTIQNQQERRALNDGIEDAFINTATYAAGIRTYYMIRRGVIKDLYEQFYFNFAILIELTEGLEELGKDRETVIEAHKWLSGNGAGQSEADIRKRCDAGLEVFTKFKTLMSARGLLALPSKGGR
jgi:hypothetical protein